MGQDRRFRVALEREQNDLVSVGHPVPGAVTHVVPVRPIVARPASKPCSKTARPAAGVSGNGGRCRQESRRPESSLLQLPALSPQEQLLVGLQDGMTAVGRLALEGVTDPKVIASSMVMAGIALLEMAESRETVGRWLRGVAERYAEEA